MKIICACGIREYSDAELTRIAIRTDSPDLYGGTKVVLDHAVEAAKYGSLNLFRKFLDMGYQWSQDGDEITSSAGSGNLDMMMWLLNHGCGWDSVGVTSAAASGGHLHILKWAIQDPKYPLDDDICEYAAVSGKLDILKWGVSNNFNIDDWASIYAAEGGHKDVLNWLWDTGKCPKRPEMTEYAIKGGHTSALVWTLDKGLPICDDPYMLAISCDCDIEILKTLRSYGYDWDSEVPYALAEMGNFDTLMWVILNECPVDERVAIEVAVSGDLVTLMWICDNECPLCDEVCLYASAHETPVMLEYLRSIGCPWSKEDCANMASGDTLEWILSQPDS